MKLTLVSFLKRIMGKNKDEDSDCCGNQCCITEQPDLVLSLVLSYLDNARDISVWMQTSKRFFEDPTLQREFSLFRLQWRHSSKLNRTMIVKCNEATPMVLNKCWPTKVYL